MTLIFAMRVFRPSLIYIVTGDKSMLLDLAFKKSAIILPERCDVVVSP
jgi:hypothetical protein